MSLAGPYSASDFQFGPYGRARPLGTGCLAPATVSTWRDSDQPHQLRKLACVHSHQVACRGRLLRAIVKIVPIWKDIDRATSGNTGQNKSGLVSNPRRYVKSGGACRRTHRQNRGTRQGVRGSSTARPQRPRNRPPISSARRTAGSHRPVWPRPLYAGGFPNNGIPHVCRSGKASTAGRDLPALSASVPRHWNPEPIRSLDCNRRKRP